MFIEEKEAYKNFMKLMKDFMKTQGFTRRGNNFLRRHPDGNVGIIDFQKAKYSIATFYINVGVYSVTLAEFFLEMYNEKQVRTHPSGLHCHWSRRIEDFVPRESPDYKRVSRGQWDCEYDANIEALAAEVSYLIATYAIPAIENRITDKQILDSWFAIRSGESVCWDSLEKMTVLAMVVGDREKFEILLAEFKKRLPTLSETSLAGRVTRANYHKIIKEAGLEKEGF